MRHDGETFLLVQTRSLRCALPIPSVIETLRPLPFEPLAGQPAFVRGVSMIRGTTTPVIDVGVLIGGGESGSFTRFVTVRVGERSAALAVDSVLGLRSLDATLKDQLPPLLRHVGEETIRLMTTLDSSMLAVLDAARVVPEDVWRALDKAAT